MRQDFAAPHSEAMNRDALVVGINTYHWDGLPHLKPPAEDAEVIAPITLPLHPFHPTKHLMWRQLGRSL